jgi:Putative Flp pilus-assembly TadE/G-like
LFDTPNIAGRRCVSSIAKILAKRRLTPLALFDATQSIVRRSGVCWCSANLGMSGMQLRRKFSPEIARLFRRLWREPSGSVAIMLGVALPVVIGLAALGTEIAFSLVKHRQLQIVADAAALDAAIAVQKGYPNFTIEAQAVAASLGEQNGAKRSHCHR